MFPRSTDLKGYPVDCSVCMGTVVEEETVLTYSAS